MHRSAFVRLARVAALGLVVGGFGSVAVATPMAWDQAKVTAIAGQLADSVKDVRYDVRQTPQAMVGSPTWRAQYATRESLRILVNTSKRLVTQLKAGEDKDATLPTYKRLTMVARDVVEDGKKANVPASTIEKVEAARVYFDQLAPYYEDPAPAADAAPTP